MNASQVQRFEQLLDIQNGPLLTRELRRYCASNSHLPMNYDKQTTGLLRMHRASSSY